MGAYWLDGRVAGYPSLADVIRGAGLTLRTWEGWQNRARGSGGFDAVWGVVAHHTASPPTSSFDNDWRYCAVGHPDAPVANMLLGRDGTVGLHAGGASNHAGKGGPWPTSQGTIAADLANARAIGIEAQNNGVGELWAPVMVDAYERLVAALCSAYRLIPAPDVWAHFRWAPGRKIDPWGGSTATPGFAYTGPRQWLWDATSGFPAGVARRMAGTPGPTPEDDDVAYLYSDPRWANTWLIPGGQNVDGAGAGALIEQGVPQASSQNDHVVAACCHASWGLEGESPAAIIDLAVRGGFLV